MDKMKCWVCGMDDFFPVGGTDGLSLQPESFKISDAHYGVSLPRYRCKSCGFVQCATTDVTSYYEQLKDEEYIESSDQRALQFEKLLKTVDPYIRKRGNLLDIGAGSGIFLREAMKHGFSVTGIEPSEYLVNKAKMDELNIICGTFPDDCPEQKYDVVFLTDVIEHIVDPLSMLRRIHDYLAENGRVIITTPDVSSIMARLLGKHWWHYRVAHVGYYNRETLQRIMERAGFVPIKWKYAKWYFSSRYIMERLTKYLPFVKPLAKVASEKLMIPVNLYDSWLGIFEVKK